MTKMIIKICVDIGMTAAMLFLMTYEMLGQTFHECLGIGMFVLFVIHHIFNHKWFGTLLKGKYTPFRIWQTALVLLVLLSMVGSMVSGVIISRSVLSFLPIHGGRAFGRSLHMLSAYWGFVLMSLHFGVHWNMMMGIVRDYFKALSAVHIWILRIVAAFIAGYGVYAMIHRRIGRYMLMLDHFVFFDIDELLVYFMLDYAAVMALFVFVGHYSAFCLRQIHKEGKENKDL